MFEVVAKSLSFASEAVHSNFFGLGCPPYCSPPYCTQPSLVLPAFTGLLGFVLGCLATCYLLWAFCPLGFSPSSSSPATPPSNRYSALVGYLHEQQSGSRRRRHWAHLPAWPTWHLHPWPFHAGCWVAILHHPTWSPTSCSFSCHHWQVFWVWRVGFILSSVALVWNLPLCSTQPDPIGLQLGFSLPHHLLATPSLHRQARVYLFVGDGPEPYVLSAYPGPKEDGMVETFVVPIMKQEEGVLLAVPTGIFPAEFLKDVVNENLFKSRCWDWL